MENGDAKREPINLKEALVNNESVLADCQNKIAKVRVVFDEIETAQLRGWKLVKIWEILNAHGFEIKSLLAFKDILRRIRDERGVRGSKARRVGENNSGKELPAQRFAGSNFETNAVNESVSTEIRESETIATETGSPFAGKSGKQKREAVADRYCPPNAGASNLLNKLIGDKK